MGKEIIENWFRKIKNGDNINIRYANRLIRIIMDFQANRKTYKLMICKLGEDETSNNGDQEFDHIELNDCIFFYRLDKLAYTSFTRSKMKLGFISQYISWDHAYILFNKLTKDKFGNPLYSGIVKYTNYLGTIKKNKRYGFGLCNYTLPISRHHEWNIYANYPDSFPVTKTITLFYSGNWINDMKHGIGIISEFNDNYYCGNYISDLEHGKGIISTFNDNYDCNDFYLIGLWQNDKLVKLYNSNESKLNIIEQLINFRRYHSSEEYEDSEEYEAPAFKAIEATNVSLDEISDLFAREMEQLIFPVIA